jgi:transcription elongation factor GreA
VAEQAISDQDLSLQEAISRYVRSLADGKPDVAAEVTRFGRWFGGDRPMRSLRPADIERYGEETSKNPVDASRRLESVRGFLAYAKKQGITETNLATHLRLRRTGVGDAAGDAATSDRIEVSADGLTALQAELGTLIARRPEIADELRLAMADKDFRENAPLDAAREKQAHLEARIRELEATLKRAVVIESTQDSTGRARMGSRITLLQLDTNQQKQYVLVGPGEVNAGQGRISVQSPVGRAVLNRGPGEEVEVMVPAGLRRFRIEAVES